ncbi:MAG: hypothetical protein M3041_06620 [Acidobacteriota bacterium]|nr:hypothetical protein [Acidobacteriota bacterium]
MRSRLLSLMYAIVAGLVLSCGVDQRPEYSIVLLNTGSTDLNDVAIKYGTFTSLGGVLIPNAESVQGGVLIEVPDVVTVVWTTIDGKHHEERVPVRGRRPFRKLTVVINGDQATATLST